MAHTRILLGGLALAFALAGCTKSFVAPPGTEKRTVVGALLSAEHRIMADIMTYGYPDQGMLRYREGYVLSYDGERRVPRWVAERLDAKRLEGPHSAEGVLYRVDPSIPAALSSRSSDYEGSGYVRGRLAAAANHPNHAVALQQTFYMSNAAPQIGGGFRQNFWVHLEKSVRDWARESDALYVVTGTIFSAEAEGGSVSYPVIGANRVGVPSHFYKVLLRVKGKSYDMRAFLVPHREYEPGVSPREFLVSVDDLEARTGLDFWRELSEPTQAGLESANPGFLWGEAAPPAEPAPAEAKPVAPETAESPASPEEGCSGVAPAGCGGGEGCGEGCGQGCAEGRAEGRAEGCAEGCGCGCGCAEGCEGGCGEGCGTGCEDGCGCDGE